MAENKDEKVTPQSQIICGDKSPDCCANNPDCRERVKILPDGNRVVNGCCQYGD